MKTPDEIKKGLECCKLHFGDMYTDCPHCPYYLTSAQCDLDMHDDALTLIQQLQSENAEKAERIRQLEAERDAAVEDMTKIVQEYGEPYCEYCGADFKPNCTGRCWTHNEGFKWRGVQKEE